MAKKGFTLCCYRVYYLGKPPAQRLTKRSLYGLIYPETNKSIRALEPIITYINSFLFISASRESFRNIPDISLI